MIWLNGQLVETEAAQLSVMDRATLLGEGIFETLKFHGGKIILFNEHWARLSEAAAFFNFELDYSADDIQSAMLSLIQQEQHSMGSLRLSITGGTGGRGLVPARREKLNWIIACAPDTKTEPTANFIDLAIVSVMRAEANPSSRFKTLSYIDNIAARNQAIARNADEAILLNSRQQIACAGAGNIFLWLDDALLTPPISDGALPGIIRAEVLKQGTIAGLACREASLHGSLIKDADGVIVTNSLIGAQAARRIFDGEIVHIKRDEDVVETKKGPPRIEAILKEIRKLAN